MPLADAQSKSEIDAQIGCYGASTRAMRLLVMLRPLVPIGNSILLAADIESGDAPALCERSVA